MAKRKPKVDKTAQDESALLLEIMSETGGETLREAGNVPYYVDSGNLSINYLMSGKFLGGGFPGGRIIEAYGPEASGKSLLGYCFLGSIQRMGGIAIQMDCERAAGADFAQRCGHVDPDRLVTYYPITLKQVEKKITTVVEKIRSVFPDKPIGIVWDSIGVNPCEREWNEIELPENPTKQQIKDAGGQERPGERAREAGAVLRKLNPFLAQNNATIYIINQVRKKIGVLFGSDETTGGGGEALKFYASIRLRCGSPQFFAEDGTGVPLGVNMAIRNKKNRHFTPGLSVSNVPLFFDSGIHPIGGLLDCLVMSRRIEGEKGNWTVNEPWAGNETNRKFKQSKSELFKAETLYRFPALIDAASEEEVHTYLTEWEEAMAQAEADNVLLKSSNEDDVNHLLGEDVQKSD